MCYNLGFWEGDPKPNVCCCLLMLEKTMIVDKRCALLLHYVFLFWLWQNKPAIVFVTCCMSGNQLSGCICPYKLWHANLTNCLFEFWSCFAFCTLHNETCIANRIRVQYCTSIPGDFAIFSKSNVNRLDPHSSWGCPPTTSSNITETDWNHQNVVMNFQIWFTDTVIMAGSHVKHRQRKASKQTTVSKNICSIVAILDRLQLGRHHQT